MAGPVWKNVYRLSDDQISRLDLAEERMEMMDISESERILLELLEEDVRCVPVLNNLGHLNGRHLSDFEKAIEYYCHHFPRLVKADQRLLWRGRATSLVPPYGDAAVAELGSPGTCSGIEALRHSEAQTQVSEPTCGHFLLPNGFCHCCEFEVEADIIFCTACEYEMDTI